MTNPQSVIASFYYGDISYPSKDIPRIGLKSTVPVNAADRLVRVVEEAKRKRMKTFT
jgi:phytepsin